VEDQPAAADRDDVAGVQRAPAVKPLGVDEGAVARSSVVDDRPYAAHVLEVGM